VKNDGLVTALVDAANRMAERVCVPVALLMAARRPGERC